MNPLSMAELGILDWIAAHCHNSFWDAVMPFITGLGDQGILWILLGVLILFFQKGERATGAQVLVSLLFSLILCNLMLKNAVDRIRPCDLNTAVELLVARPDFGGVLRMAGSHPLAKMGFPPLAGIPHKTKRNRTVIHGAVSSYFPKAAFFSQAAMTASITAARTARCSSVRTPWMVLPPGLQTSFFN